MKGLLFSCLFVVGVVLVASEETLVVGLHEGAPPQQEAPAGAQPPSGESRYHQRVGVPLAQQLRTAEEQAQEQPQRGFKAAPRIVGGLASYVGEHPFFGGLVIVLWNGQTSVCGSALVTNDRLVTAAQCWWDGRDQAYSITAVLGSTRLFSGGLRVPVSAVIAHGQYNPATLANDIAVLVIPYVPSTSNYRPVALPVGAELYNSFAGTRPVVIGFGKTSDLASITSSAALRDVFVTVLTNSACASVYGGSVTEGVVCTSGAGARGPCGGDGGGPLVLNTGGRRVLIGLVSFVSAAGCQRGDPAGYTRITAYSSWLNAQL